MEGVTVLEKLERGEIAAAPAVRRQALRELREYRAASRREAVALSRGWEPWDGPHGITFGLVEPPQRRYRLLLVGALIIAGAVALMAAILVSGLPFAHDAMPLLVVVSGVVLSVGGAIGGSVMVVTQCADAGSELRTPSRRQLGRASHGGDYLVYCGAMPIPAWQKYQRDRDLFDHVYVASHNASAFERHRVWTADPFLVGEIQGKLYLGAHWDLATEVELAQKAKQRVSS